MLSRNFSVSTEECRRLILSLAIALRDFHESGFCVSGGFGESNLVVSGHTKQLVYTPCVISAPDGGEPKVEVLMGFSDPGKFKLQDVDFERSTSDGIESNYRDARAFIVSTMFQGQEAEIPDDIKHPLQLMASPEAASTGQLIATHASLVPLVNRRMFYKECCDHVREILPEGQAPGENSYIASYNTRIARRRTKMILFYQLANSSTLTSLSVYSHTYSTTHIRLK